MEHRPGLVVLFGSGERAPSAQRVYDRIMSTLRQPIKVSVLETPAGFELNSDYVAGRVAGFIRERLQNYHPEVLVLPARKKGTEFSPDNAEIVAPMLDSNMIFMGPGSPTYTVRQLRDSLALQTMTARHRLGAAIVLASAASISIGCCALPVYEIYKVGEDPFWNEGLDFWKPYGLNLAIVSHWDNEEGGANLDTSRCFMGRSRFAILREMLPEGVTILGIDEHTACIMDVGNDCVHVMGRGGVTVIRDRREREYQDGESFNMTELGEYTVPEPQAGIPEEVWLRALRASEAMAASPEPSPEVCELVEERERAREKRDWAASDTLRDEIAALGWQVMDTPDGTHLEPL